MLKPAREAATLAMMVAKSSQRLTFPQAVYAAVRTVPPGAVTTYGDVAAFLGNPRMARQVGWALSALPEATDIPWQRVINARGQISFRGDTARAQEQLCRLESEGVLFNGKGACELDDHRWGFVGSSVFLRSNP